MRFVQPSSQTSLPRRSQWLNRSIGHFELSAGVFRLFELIKSGSNPLRAAHSKRLAPGINLIRRPDNIQERINRWTHVHLLHIVLSGINKSAGLQQSQPQTKSKTWLIFNWIRTSVKPIDSSWRALQFTFWVRDNRMKRLATNRQKQPRPQRHLSLPPHFIQIFRQTLRLIELVSKDFWQNISRAIEWCACLFNSLNNKRVNN